MQRQVLAAQFQAPIVPAPEIAMSITKNEARKRLHERALRTTKRYYLQRAVDQDGQVLHILVQKYCNTEAACVFHVDILWIQ